MNASPAEAPLPVAPERLTSLFAGASVPLLPGNEIHLWLCPLPLPDEDLRRTVEALPDQGERERAARLVFAADRRRQIHGRGLLRLVLGHYLARPPASLAFVANDYGKPELRHADGLHFNFSRCHDLALIGLTRVSPVGVDVERIRPLPDRNALIAHCLSDGERDWLASRPAQQQERDFFRLWTGKEAVLKSLGTGLATPPESVSVSLRKRGIGNGKVAGARGRWTLFSACPDADHIIAAAIPALSRRAQVRCFQVGGASLAASDGMVHRPTTTQEGAC